MRRMGAPMIRTTIAVLAMFAVAPLAQADFSECMLEVYACDESGVCQGFCAVNTSMGTGYWEGGTYYWTLTQDVPIVAPDETVVGVLEHDDGEGTSVAYAQDPRAQINFSVTAGSAATRFRIVSSHVTFPTIVGGTGYAETNMGVTDRNFNGGYLNSVVAGDGKAFGFINGNWPGGTQWSELLDTDLTAGVGGSANAFDSTGSYYTLGQPVSSIYTMVDFMLSARDLAIGTAMFDVVPEPATFVMLAGLALLRRR